MNFSRQKILYGALAVSVVLVAWTAWNDSNDNADMVASRPNTKSPAENVGLVHGLGFSAKPNRPMTLDRDPLIEASADPFAVVNFVPPAPIVAPPPPPPPPKPTAPTFPYRFFGRMTDIDGIKTTYLQRGDDLLAIQDKQIVDTNYRVESIDEKQIVIVYLPLEEKTVLNIQTAENK